MQVIIGKKAGFCMGITNTIEQTKSVLQNKMSEVTYCLGDLAHNPVVMNKLKSNGLKVIDDLSEIEKTENQEVIIRAHGATKQVYEQAEKLGIKLIDLTCPNVLLIHKIVNEYAKRGYHIIYIGEQGHPEVIGTASFCGESYDVIETKNELEQAIEKINKNKISKILIVAQTTFNLQKFEEYCKLIENEIKAEIAIKNTICSATRERQQETLELSKNVDYMIIIGGKNSSNTNKLFDISCENCKNVIMIENEQELTLSDIEKIKKFNNIGIMAGASTPQESIEAVKRKIMK